MLLSQKSGENKTPVVQMQILKVTNRTSPTHPHCIRYWTFTQTLHTEQVGKEMGVFLVYQKSSPEAEDGSPKVT